jgi:hypothetical protein
VNTQPEQGVNPEPEQEPAAAKDHSSGRTWAMRGLAALASLVLILGALAVWVNRVALDSSQWSDTSVKVIQNDTVQSTLATYLVNQLYDNVNVAATIESFLPDAAKPFAPTVAEGLRAPATSAAQRALASPRLQEAWRTANERANRQLLRVIDDDKGALTTNGGAVVLDLRPLVLQVEGAAAGLGVSNRLPALPPNAGHITLLKSDQLSFMQTSVHALKAAADFLVIIVVLIFAAAIWVAPDRRRAVRACAIALLVAGLVLIFLRRVLGDQLIDKLVVDETVRPAAHQAWWIATDPLRLITTTIVFVGIIGLFGAWVSGAGKHATTLRRWAAPYLREPWMAFGGLALVVLLLLAWSPTPAAHNWITTPILIIMAVAGLEVLRRQTAREFPASQYPRRL